MPTNEQLQAQLDALRAEVRSQRRPTRRRWLLPIALTLVLAPVAAIALPPLDHVFMANDPIVAQDMNDNFGALHAGITATEGRLDTAESTLAALQAVNASGRLDGLEGADMTINGRLDVVEAIDPDSRLDALEADVIPQGAVMAFNLEACPSGWGRADGMDGRVDARHRFLLDKDRTGLGGLGGYSTIRVETYLNGTTQPNQPGSTSSGTQIVVGGVEPDEGFNRTSAGYGGAATQDWIVGDDIEMLPRYVAVLMCEKL